MWSGAGAPAIANQPLQSAGEPLNANARASLEPRFGHDLSFVRVHADQTAARAAHALRAQAYTIGRHIVFGAGRYDPLSNTGQRLLAHELAHVVQQQSGSSATGRVLRNGVDADEDSAGTEPPVYLCSKSLETSPLGSHAFFRIGGSGTGNPTISLEPIDTSLGADCWQGIPDHDYPSDFDADATCERTTLSRACLERELSAYPIGHYCTFGPNSNTFVGVVARACGLANPDPAGWTPGIDDAAPPSGTYAPDKWKTLRGCETKICIIGPEIPEPPIG